MTHRLVTAAVLILAFSAAALCGQDAQTDLDKLQGTWAVTAIDANGKPRPLKGAKMTVTFAGDLMVMTMEGSGPEDFDRTEHRIELDPSKKPKSLDANATTTGGGRNCLCIYQLEGDEMKLCVPIAGLRTERPTDFKSAEGSNLAIMTLKRSKK